MAVAEDSPHPKWHMGAVITRGSRIIATGYNVRKNNPALTDGAPGTSVHAEEAALKRLVYQADRAEGCTLYVARISKTGEPRLARPCLGCWHRLIGAGIRNICYTLNGSGYGVEMLTGVLRN